VTVLADEGWSGKNLDRPAVQELLKLVELGQVKDLLIWRWDRLSRDQGDFATLVKLLDRHGVKVHSVNEGDLDLASASGRMQIGCMASSPSTTETRSSRTRAWDSARQPSRDVG